MADSYDVIIVGAGMVGAAAACLLSKSDATGKIKPLKIALVEASLPACDHGTNRQPLFNPRHW